MSGRRCRRRWDPASTHRAVGRTSNLRDLGGTPAGTTWVAPRRLYRAEALVRSGTGARNTEWDPRDGTPYGRLGVRTVIDLRGVAESERSPTAWPEATGAVLRSVPLEHGVEGDTDVIADLRAGRRSRFTVDDLAAFYVRTFEACGERFGQALRLIGARDEAPVLVHCAAGKDRTGLVIALVLEALGVDREDVVADYALTGLLRPNRVAAYRDVLDAVGVESADVAPLFEAPPAALAAALAHLDQEYDGPVGYLRRAGDLDGAEIAALRRTLLVRPS